MTTLEARERETYREMFESHEFYSNNYSPGEHAATLFADMACLDPARRFQGTALDAGAGRGKGALALARLGFAVTALDLDDFRLPEARALTIPFVRACLWDDLRPHGFFDHVYCCDTLEHVPPEFTMLVVSRLLAVARRGVFLSISLRPDNLGVWVGKPLHQTVRSFVWWRDNLRALGTLAEARDLILQGFYYMRPRGAEDRTC